MIQFVNAKINIGLNIIRRRPDGYHDLQTLFYPIGLHSGTPENPDPFCDILEIVPGMTSRGFSFSFAGRKVDCPEDKNLVCRAARLFAEKYAEKRELELSGFSIELEKHLPDGAGLGGGSADASFTLRMLNELSGAPFSSEELEAMALTLGADCPVFITNVPAFGEGVGEKLTPSDTALDGMWLALVKPDVYVSTREAFSGVTPEMPAVPLAEALQRSIEEWRHCVFNDFERSIFPLHPELAAVKESLYRSGALYASMSGSGSSLYGIFPTEKTARRAVADALSAIGENPAAFSSVLKL